MFNKNNSKYFFLIITLFILSTNSFAANKVKSSIKMLDGSPVPDTVVFYDDKGEQYSLDKFEGKTILLVFWATWCGSCTKDMPDLDMLQKDFRKLPFTIIPVSQDYQGIEAVKKYYSDYGIRYLPLYHDFKNQLFKAFEIVGIPTAILISQDGKMLVSFIGAVNWFDEEIREIILSKIPGDHPEPKNSYKDQPFSQPMGRQAKPESNKEALTQDQDVKKDQESKKDAEAKPANEQKATSDKKNDIQNNRTNTDKKANAK